ncbi:hypothetical protein ACX8XN_01990 [Calditrichota bacterium GD2]
MKILVTLFMGILLSSVLFLGCGQDGEDGKAYLSFTWDWYVDSYTDNNPGVPSTIHEYTDYEVAPGTYYYEYYCSDGLGNYWGYEGTYKITINKGEKGGFLVDGEDGEDNYFRMTLSGSGPSMSLNKTTKISEKKSSLTPVKNFNGNDYKKLYVGDEIIETIYSNNGKMVIRKKMFKWIKN